MELDDIKRHLEHLDGKLDATLRLNRRVLDQRILDKVDKRVRQQPGTKKVGKAAWSRLEEVLADRRLEKDLKDGFEDEQ